MRNAGSNNVIILVKRVSKLFHWTEEAQICFKWLPFVGAGVPGEGAGSSRGRGVLLHMLPVTVSLSYLYWCFLIGHFTTSAGPNTPFVTV